MINPGGGLLRIIISETASVHRIRGHIGAHGIGVSFRAQRTHAVAGQAARGKFLRPIAKAQGSLLVAQEHVVSRARLVVAQVKHALRKRVRSAKAHLAVQIDPAIELEQRIHCRAIDPDEEIQRPAIGYYRNADGIGQIADVQSGHDIAIHIDAAAHLEGVNRIEPCVSIRSIAAVKQRARHHPPILFDDDSVTVRDHAGSIGKRGIDAAGFGPLIAIDDVRAAWDGKLNGAAARCEHLRTDINLPVHRVQIMSRVLRFGLIIGREPHQQFRAGAVFGRRIGQLPQMRPRREADH